MVAVSVVFGGAFAGTLALGGGSVLAATMPTTSAPGISSASLTGSCHGVFGDYFGGVLSSTPDYFSSQAPIGNEGGEDNSTGGGCPYTGTDTEPEG